MPCTELRTVLDATEDKTECFDNSTVAKEGGKKFSFNNTSNKSICRVKVDNCLITGQQRRCDYLFKVVELSKYYLVELKGVNIDEGVEQIISTFEFVNKKIKASSEAYSGIIVSSSVPNAAQQKFRRLQEKHYREKKLMIRKTHFQHIERI
jgi:hypothetical protein